MLMMTWFAIRTLLVLILLLIIALKGPWDIPYVPFASHDGCSTTQPASLVPEPTGAGLGSAAGEALRNLDVPDAQATAEFFQDVAYATGETWGWFVSGLKGRGKPKVPNGSLLDRDWSQQYRSTSGCEPCPGQGSGAQPVTLTGGGARAAAQAAAAAGFSGPDLVTAVAVAGAESGWRADALNTSNSNGSTDHGMWQINSVHADLLAAGNWRDPAANARMAYAVWDRAGQSWTPWTVYKSGSYRQHLDEAAAATSGVIPAAGTSPATCTASTSASTASASAAQGGWSLPAPRSALSAHYVSKPHHDYPGADLPLPIGTDVFAVQGGKVVRAGAVSGYGAHYVEIESTTASGECVLWWYGHGSAHMVSEGETIAAGQQVIDAGNEGYSTGPHLHLGLRPCGTSLDRDVYQCPQPVLVAIWEGKPVPDPATAPKTGCIGPPLNTA